MIRTYLSSRAPALTPTAPRIALLACAVALGLAGCSSDDDGDATADPDPAMSGEQGSEADGAEPVELVELPLLGTRPVPPELSAVTGIAWHAPSEHFIVVTDTGQLGSFAGDSFALTSVVDAGTGALADVGAGADGAAAITVAGDVIALEIDAGGVPRLSAEPTVAAGFEPRGVAVPPEGGAPTISADGPTGPTLWAVDGAEVTETLRLDDPSLTATRSLAFLGTRFLASSADAPTIAVFDDIGELEVRLAPGGLTSIGGITNRDGTFVFAGIDAGGDPVLAAYDLSNGEESDPDPAAGPATLAATLASSERLALPDGVRQPSGIVYDAASDSMLLSTDQAEFFALSIDLAEVRFGFDIPGFNQGSVEDVQSVGPGQAIVVTEEADYVPFAWDGATWTAGDTVEVDAIEQEVSAVGFDPATGQLTWIPESGPGKSLVVTTLAGEPVREVDIDASAVGLENLDDYTVAGIAHHEGTFYILSEQYSTVLRMTSEGVVTAAYGLTDAAEASGITIHDGSIWIVFDHEDSQPVPPVARFALPQAS